MHLDQIHAVDGFCPWHHHVVFEIKLCFLDLLSFTPVVPTLLFQNFEITTDCWKFKFALRILKEQEVPFYLSCVHTEHQHRRLDKSRTHLNFDTSVDPDTDADAWCEYCNWNQCKTSRRASSWKSMPTLGVNRPLHIILMCSDDSVSVA